MVDSGMITIENVVSLVGIGLDGLSIVGVLLGITMGKALPMLSK